MKTVTVHASTTYEVKIGTGLLNALGSEVKAICKASKACIISDSNVFPLYGSAVVESLRDAEEFLQEIKNIQASLQD